MSSTKEEILKLGETLIRKKGYNAFSYQDISKPLQIKNAAVHYYFPKKSDLAIQIFKAAKERFDSMWAKHANDDAATQLKAFVKTYSDSSKYDMVCLVGAMAAEFYSLEPSVQAELKLIVTDIEQKLTAILREGKKNKQLSFVEPPHTKALMIITNLLAGLQLARINGKTSFEIIRNNILKEL